MRTLSCVLQRCCKYSEIDSFLLEIECFSFDIWLFGSFYLLLEESYKHEAPGGKLGASYFLTGDCLGSFLGRADSKQKPLNFFTWTKILQIKPYPKKTR